MKERPAQQPDEHQIRHAAILQRLESAVGQIHDSESFRRYLDAQARFPTYSFRNALLIAQQRPDATRVAGYNAWARLGRQVRRGEQGIAILVPHVRRTKTADDEDERRLLGFGIGHVFDVRQTTGNELPQIAVPELTGDEGLVLYQQLLALAGTEGVHVRRQHRDELPHGIMGFYQPSTREIFVRAAAQRQMTKTLAHELAHHVHLTYYGEESSARAERETVAESVAYVVAAHVGLDTGERSFPYIALWAQDRHRFQAQLGTIQRVAGRIIAEIEPRPIT